MHEKLRIGKIDGWEKPSKVKQKTLFQSEKIRNAFKNNSSVTVIEAYVNEFECNAVTAFQKCSAT